MLWLACLCPQVFSFVLFREKQAVPYGSLRWFVKAGCVIQGAVTATGAGSNRVRRHPGQPEARRERRLRHVPQPLGGGGGRADAGLKEPAGQNRGGAEG